MKVLLRTPVSPYNGYGNDGIGLVRAFLRAGVDLYLQPQSVTPPVPRYVAALFTKRLDGPFDLVLQHSHLDHEDFAASEEVRRSSDLVVGWSMWEYTSLTVMPPAPFATLAGRLRDFDVLLGYEEVTCQALAEAASENTVIRPLQGGVSVEDWAYVERDWHSERFGFFMHGVLGGRKDPFVAIEAFRELKASEPDFGPAELHLHTTVGGLHPAMEEWIDKLRVHYAVWPVEVLREFYARQHCILAPSRGEGKNVPALEFMLTGGLSIATGWGGHAVWQHPDYCHAIDYTLAPVDAEHPGALQARASKDHLKALMLGAFRDRTRSREMGALASRAIRNSMSWEVTLDRLFDVLKGTGPEGENVWRLYQEARTHKNRPSLDVGALGEAFGAGGASTNDSRVAL